MENKNLSKQKYIWLMATSYNGIINVEKFPVVYINRAYVYFKTVNGGRLCELRVDEVLDSIDKKDMDRLGLYKTRIWSWSDPTNAYDNPNSLYKEIQKSRLDARIKELEYDLSRLDGMANVRKRELEKLLKEKEKTYEVV